MNYEYRWASIEDFKSLDCSMCTFERNKKVLPINIKIAENFFIAVNYKNKKIEFRIAFFKERAKYFRSASRRPLKETVQFLFIAMSSHLEKNPNIPEIRFWAYSHDNRQEQLEKAYEIYGAKLIRRHGISKRAQYKHTRKSISYHIERFKHLN